MGGGTSITQLCSCFTKTFCLPFLLISCSISQLQEETKSFADFMFEDWTASEVGPAAWRAAATAGLLCSTHFWQLSCAASAICGDSGLDRRPCW